MWGFFPNRACKNKSINQKKTSAHLSESILKQRLLSANLITKATEIKEDIYGYLIKFHNSIFKGMLSQILLKSLSKLLYHSFQEFQRFLIISLNPKQKQKNLIFVSLIAITTAQQYPAPQPPALTFAWTKGSLGKATSSLYSHMYTSLPTLQNVFLA